MSRALGAAVLHATACGDLQRGLLLEHSNSRPRAASRDRTSGGSSFARSSADTQKGPRGESNSSYNSARGSLGGALAAGFEPGVVQFGLDHAALGVVQLPVVDADLRERRRGSGDCSRSPALPAAAPQCPGRRKSASMPCCEPAAAPLRWSVAPSGPQVTQTISKPAVRRASTRSPACRCSAGSRAGVRPGRSSVPARACRRRNLPSRPGAAPRRPCPRSGRRGTGCRWAAPRRGDFQQGVAVETQHGLAVAADGGADLHGAAGAGRRFGIGGQRRNGSARG